MRGPLRHDSVPTTYYGFALERTDGGPPWVVYPGCGNSNEACGDIRLARERVQSLLKVDGINKVTLVRVTHSVMEIHTDG